MANYLCRWPNGDFSIVSARNKSAAIEMLDEWGNAEQATLLRLTDCMFDFRLCNDGRIELEDIGETTREHIMKVCYPELDNAFATAGFDETGQDYSEEGQNRIREAVEVERKRQWDGQPSVRSAETEIGREIQKHTGAASAVVNRIVREAATRRLKAKEGEGRKPN